MIIGIIYTTKDGTPIKDIALNNNELLRRLATANKYGYKIRYEDFGEDYERAERFLLTKDDKFTK